jgi:hypothetical protein
MQQHGGGERVLLECAGRDHGSLVAASLRVR